MPSIQDIRQQYPQYDDLSDDQLAQALHQKYYSDIDYSDFTQRIGLTLPKSAIREAFQQGATTKELAAQFGTTERKVLEQLSFPQRMRNDVRLLGDAAIGIVRGVPQIATDTASVVANPLGMAANAVVPGAPFSTNVSGDFGQAMTDLGVPETTTAAGRAANELTRTGGSMALGQSVMNRLTPTASRAVQTREAIQARPTPTSNELRQVADTAYRQAREAGVNISDDAYQRTLNQIQFTLKEAGFNPRLHPKVNAALNELARARNAGGVTFQDFENLRRVVKSAAASIEPDERRVAQLVIEKMDDFVRGMSDADVTQGNAGLASNSIRIARDAWSRMRKGETIGELFERAANRAETVERSGIENALRTEFRRVAQNPRMMRTFSEAEQNAIRHVARGDPLVNTLRWLGKLAPHQNSALQNLASGGLGFVLSGGNPYGAATTLIGGQAAKQAATFLTTKNARAAYELALRGAPLSAAQAKALDPLIAGLLLGTAGQVESEVAE